MGELASGVVKPGTHHVLTAFFAEDKKKLCSCLLHTHVHMCHQANQLVSQRGADLWPDLHVLQRRKHLEVQTLRLWVVRNGARLIQDHLLRLV